MLFILNFPVHSQVTQGKITYQQTIKMDFETPPEMKAMGRELPKERTRLKELYFDQTGSIYKDGPRIKDGDEESSQRRRRRNRRPRDNKYYKDLSSGKTMDKRDLMGKSFLIEDDPELQWKMTGEQKTILDYVCMKASTEKDSSIIHAWFTPQIPLSIGPGSFHGLPGAILSLESDDQKMTITASEIVLNEALDIEIKAPKKGDKISSSDYQILEAEKMKEREKMRASRRSGHGRRGRN